MNTSVFFNCSSSIFGSTNTFQNLVPGTSNSFHRMFFFMFFSKVKTVKVDDKARFPQVSVADPNRVASPNWFSGLKNQITAVAIGSFLARF